MEFARALHQMADAEIQSRYVKLNKDQAPVDINPGELNQPIEVPQVSLQFVFCTHLWLMDPFYSSLGLVN